MVCKISRQLEIVECTSVLLFVAFYELANESRSHIYAYSVRVANSVVLCDIFMNILSALSPSCKWNNTGMDLTYWDICHGLWGFHLHQVWWRTDFSLGLKHSLKRKCHLNEIFITGCTWSCQNNNPQCSQRLQFRPKWHFRLRCYTCEDTGSSLTSHFLYIVT